MCIIVLYNRTFGVNGYNRNGGLFYTNCPIFFPAWSIKTHFLNHVECPEMMQGSKMVSERKMLSPEKNEG